METEKKKRRGNKRSRGFNPNEDELSVIEALIRFCEIHKKINSKQTQFLSSDSLSTAFTSWGIKRRRSVVENPPLPSPPLQSQPRSLNIPPVIEKESKITSPVSPLIFSTCPGGGDSNQKSKSLPLTLKRSSPPLDKQGRREREKSKRISKKGIEKFKKAAQDAQGKVLSGQDAFVLCDTYGFPLDLTELMAAERGLTVDVKGFNAAMDEARERSRSAQNQQVGGAIAMDANATASLHQRGISPTDDSSKFICHVFTQKKKELENVDIELTKENALLKKSIQKKMYESQQLKAENSMLENKKRKLLILWSSEKEAKEKVESPTVKKKGKEHAKLELQTFNNGCPQLSALQARQEEEEQLLGRYYHDYDQRQLLSRYYYVYEKKQQRQQEVKKFQKCNSQTTVDGKEPKKENSFEKDEQNKQGTSSGGIDLNQLPDDDEGGENIPSIDVTNSNNMDLRMSLDIDNKRRGIGGLISLDAFEKAELEKRMRAISIQAACKANREERMRKNREKKMKVARMQPVMIAKQ